MRLAYWPICLAALAGSIGLYFSQQIGNGFTILFGEPFDGTIQAVLVSHWFKALQGLQPWNEVPYFFPYHDTLGYNDAVFVTGLLAIPFRLAGLDLYRACEAALVVLKIQGFVFMIVLMDRLIGPRRLAGILGAVLFTMMIGLSNQSDHTQLLTVSLAPLALLLLLRAIDALPGSPHPFLARSAAFLAVMGMWLISSFYMAFFFGLLCGGMLATQAACDRASLRIAWRHLIVGRGCRLLGLVVLSAMSAAPFLLIYGPKLAETHGHHIRAALAYALVLPDLINIGPGSLVWGPASAWLQALVAPKLRGGEFVVGFTPDILAAMAILAVFVYRRRLTLSPTLRAIAGAAVILLILPLSIHDISPWWLVFKLIPGAAGVRTISRCWLMLAFPVAILVALAIDRIGRARAWLAVPAAILLIASQIDRAPPVAVDAASQMAALARVPPPPATCRSFFVTSRPTTTDRVTGLYIDNVFAMLVADHADIPTIGGFSTFNPPDWDFAALPPETFLARVQRYAAAHRLSGLCAYDRDAERWTLQPG